jgi:hypothetical protein
MPALSEARIQYFIDHAQSTLFLHDHYRPGRDHAYQEALEFVDELVDLLLEIRRERAALERIAAMREECERAARSGRADPGLALRMCDIACDALGLASARAEERAGM